MKEQLNLYVTIVAWQKVKELQKMFSKFHVGINPINSLMDALTSELQGPLVREEAPLELGS